MVPTDASVRHCGGLREEPCEPKGGGEEENEIGVREAVVGFLGGDLGMGGRLGGNVFRGVRLGRVM